MSNEKELSFEQIDAHIKAANLADYEPNGAKTFSAADIKAAPADVLQKICGIYNVIKPILSGILLMPFIPAPWKAAIRTFMGLMGSICG